MPRIQRVGHVLARLLRHRLFLLAALIGAAYLFSIGAALARPPSPGKVPNGNVYYCGTCHESGHTFSDGSFPVPSSPVHGSGMRDPFGSTTPIKTWTLDLANQDSDGDGFTNGEELQDPAGTWAIGQPDPGDLFFVSNPSDNNPANDSNECSLSYRATPPEPKLLDIVGYASPASGDVSFGVSTLSPLPIDFVRYTVKNGSNATVYESFSTSAPFRSSTWNTKAVPDGSYTVTAQVVEKRNKAGVTARSVSSVSGETIVVKNTAPSFGPVGEVIGTPENHCDIPEELNGIAAVSENDVWAVGTRFITGPGKQTFIKHWDGVRWTSVISPSAGDFYSNLHAVAASGANAVWAVGEYDDGSLTRTLIERWDGASWKIVASPNGGSLKNNRLNGVAALSPTNAWAVGDYDDGSGGQLPLILRWDGASWQSVTVPEPQGGTNIKLNGIAAASANDIWAVGYYTNASFEQSTLTMHWNGAAWSIVASPNPLTGFNQLRAVAVLPSGQAWAVGYTSDGTGFKTLAMRWTGTSWQATNTPSPGSPNNELLGVAAISASDIWAVGYGGISADQGETLALHWDGTIWKTVARPDTGTTSLKAADAVGSLVWAAGVKMVNSDTNSLVERYWVTRAGVTQPQERKVFLPLLRR
jgi:hypothetical protein